MIEKKRSFIGDLLFLVSGLTLIFLSHTGIESASPMASRALEAIGFALAGYAPIRFIISARTIFNERRTRKLIEHFFRVGVRIVSPRDHLPLFIATDIEGCITPPHRTEIDLSKFQRIRAYCEFVKSKAVRQFPPIVIYTGRSQGYVELLSQSLGMINETFDLPFVVENGTALYFPGSKKMRPLITASQQKITDKARNLLIKNLRDNEFEPKRHMITINSVSGQTIDELMSKIIPILEKNDIYGDLTIKSTASAVDITPKGVSKLVGIEKVLETYHELRPGRENEGLESIVVIGDSTSDLCLIERAGAAYCPTHDVHPEVRMLVERKFGADHVIDLQHIDFVIAVIEKECGLHLV